MTTRRPSVRLVALVGVAVSAVAWPTLAQDCPELLGQWPDDAASLVAVEEPYAYVGHESTFLVADLSDPTSPEVIGSLDFAYSISDLFATSGHVVATAFGFFVIDVSAPTAPQVEGSLDMYYVDDITVVGQYAYLTNGIPRGLYVVDISVPSSPEETGFVELQFGTSPVFTDVAVSGQHAYLPWHDDFGSPPGGLKVINVGTPSAPFEVGSVTFSNDWVGGVAVYGEYAYVGTLGGFRVVDVSTPTAPVEIGFVATQDFVGEIAIAGKLAWVADWMGGLRVLDLNEPSAPVEVGFYDPPEMITFVNVGSEYAVAVADELALLTFAQCELPVFADGFESGDTSAWSAVFP